MRKDLQEEKNRGPVQRSFYQIRRAVVHAGEKDMIFENFRDGEEAIEAVMPDVESAVLLLIGIEVS